MLNYSFSTVSNDAICSLDLIRLRVAISNRKLERFINEFVDDESHKISKTSLNGFKAFGWKHFISCTYINEKTIKMGFYINGASNERREDGFIEFNPNSFTGISEFWSDWEKIKQYFPYRDIIRFDLAFDFPMQRNKIALVKDNRIYACHRASSLDFTEYLGQRNTVGRVKLYNKQIESKLDKPLTRLEVTCDLDNINIPRIIDLRNMPKSDNALVSSVLKNDCFTLALSDMSQYNRGKILHLIEDNEIQLDKHAIDEVIAYAHRLVSDGRLLNGKLL